MLDDFYKDYRKCPYWSGVYDENVHSYECMKNRNTCPDSKCNYGSKNLFKRLKFVLETWFLNLQNKL